MNTPFFRSLLEHQSMPGLLGVGSDSFHQQNNECNFCATIYLLERPNAMNPACLPSGDVSSHAVAFMRFSQSAYSQSENNSPLSVSLTLDAFGGSGSGSAAITQDIVGQIIAFAQAGNTATGKETTRQ